MAVLVGMIETKNRFFYPRKVGLSQNMRGKKEEEVNTRTLILELLDFVDPLLDQLGSRHRLDYVHKILENGSGDAMKYHCWPPKLNLYRKQIPYCQQFAAQKAV